MSRGVVPLRNLLTINSAMLGIAAVTACRSPISHAYAALFACLTVTASAIDVFRRAHPPRLALNITSVAIFGASVARMRFGNLIMVFTEAVLLMTAVKMLEEKRARDYCQIAAMSVFTMLAAAIDAADETYIYFGLAVSVLAGFQLVLAAWFARAPGSSLTMRELRQTAGRVMYIWAMMTPVCLALFFTAPRARFTLGRVRMNVSAGEVGFSERVQLGSVAEIQEANALAFRAVMPLVAPKHLFWRGIVLDIFDGREWFSGRRGLSDRLITNGGEAVRQEIFIENGMYYRSVFALDIPMVIDAPGIASVGDGTFANVLRGERVKSYRAVSYLSDAFRPISGVIRRDRYLSLPSGLSPEILSAAGEAVRGVEDKDKPEAIMRYLSPPRFEYSMSGLPTSQSPLDEFMLRTRRGNCEYFAAAMAVMLRASGVPSRLVAGYHGGVYNENGGYYMVNQSNAHVWVEAWDASVKAWRRYDPTPVSDEAGGDALYASSGYGLLRQYVDYINYSVSRIFLEYEGESQSKIIDFVREFVTSPGASMGAFIDRFYMDRRKSRAVAAAVASVCLSLAAAGYLRYGRQSKRSRDDILRERFLKAMARLGFVKKPCDGLEKFVLGVALALGRGNPAVEAASEFVSIFEGYYFRDIPIKQADFRKLEGIIKKIGKTGGRRVRETSA